MAAIQTYSGRYDLFSNDPWEGDYGGIMSHFIPTKEAMTSQHEDLQVSATLEQSVFSSTEQPHVYLLYSTDSTESPLIHVLHRPFTLAPPLGSGKPIATYIMASDTHDQSAPSIIYWPKDAFTMTITEVLSNDDVDEALELTQEPQITYDDATQQHLKVGLRNLAFLPPQWASLALAHTPMTPRKAWTTVGGAIRNEDDNIVHTMQPLLNWLKAACMATRQPKKYAHSLFLAAPRAVYPTPVGFHPRVNSILDQEVPGWRTFTPGPNGLDQVAEAVVGLQVQLQRNIEETALRTTEATEKSPTKYWGDAIVQIHRITGTSNVAQLPELYHAIAKSNTKNLRQLIVEQLRSVARDTNLEAHVPTVTPSLCRKLSNLEFQHEDIDDLDEGFHPFIVSVKSLQDQAALNKHLHYYDSLNAGATTVHLQELNVAPC